MTPISNLSNLYNVVETDEGYTFTTDYGNEYVVTFSDIGSILEISDISIYEFGIEAAHRVCLQNDKFDGKLRNTIADILLNVFKKDPNLAILLMLDSSDGKQKERYRLFLSPKHKSWFNCCNHGLLEIIPFQINLEMARDISYLLIGKDNPKRNEIQQSVTDYISTSFEEDDINQKST